METQLKELIDKIKSEGVAEAEQEADRIVGKAKEQASSMTAKARQEAERIIAEAGAEADKLTEAGRESLKQAGRDLLLGLRSSITSLFEKVVAADARDALSEKELQDIIKELISAWQEKGVEDIQILLSEDDFRKVTDGMFKKLAEEMKKGVEFKPQPDIQAGFKIGTKDGSAYYDFTDEGIAEFLAAGLSPRLAECMKTE